MSKPEKKPLPPDWIIHLLGNGIQCERCGEIEENYPDFICNAHTHGMDKYGHMDFQMVIHAPVQDICYVLNTLGDRVRNGQRFKAGDMVEGIFLDCSVRLDEFVEDGRLVLRVIIPDGQNRFPEDQHCKYPYSFQTFTKEFMEELKKLQGEQMA